MSHAVLSKAKWALIGAVVAAPFLLSVGAVASLNTPANVCFLGWCTQWQVAGTGSAGGSMSIVRYATVGSGGAVYVGAATRSPEGAAYRTALLPNDGIASMESRPDDGHDFPFSGNLIFKVDGPVSPNVVPTRFEVNLANPTDGSVDAAFRVDSKKNFGNTVTVAGGLDAGDGAGVMPLRNAISIPTVPPGGGGGSLFASNGSLYWLGSRGTVTLIAPP